MSNQKPSVGRASPRKINRINGDDIPSLDPIVPKCDLAIAEYVRRSVRDPSIALLEKSDFKSMIEKVKSNDPDSVVFKLKNHMISDINHVVLDAIIDALQKNNVCQALYVQNLSRAFGDAQLNHLIELLQKRQIWCLNIGENYEISNKGWEHFCNSLPSTSVTHLYVSEHVISIDLKNRMRANIRENRKKHDKHCSMKNLHVIERCTNMWWNPINGVKELRPPPPVTIDPVTNVAVATVHVLTPAHTAYWQEGRGPGGDVKWKFNCMCGETCSSYENYRYHPIGKMYECSKCSVWSHVSCVLGERVSDDDLEEMTDLMCNGCRSKTRRWLKSLSPEEYAALEAAQAAEKRAVEEANVATTPNKTDQKHGGVQKGSGKKSGSGSKTGGGTKSKTKDTVGEEEGDWKFRCLCGEVCSSYENPRYHPAGKWYECTSCATWSHVVCMFGAKTTDEDMSKIQDALCNVCKCKARRVRSRGDPAATQVENTTASAVMRQETAAAKVLKEEEKYSMVSEEGWDEVSVESSSGAKANICEQVAGAIPEEIVQAGHAEVECALLDASERVSTAEQTIAPPPTALSNAAI